MSDAAARERRAKQTVNNLIYSLIACLAIVAIIFLITPRPTTSLVPPVDYKADAKATAAAIHKPVVAPELPGKDWYSNADRFTSGSADGVDSWYVGFVGPQQQYVGITQGYGTNPTWIALQLQGDIPTGSKVIGGISWTIWKATSPSSPAKSRDYALVADFANGKTTDQVILFGTASTAEFNQFATRLAQNLKVLYP